MVELIWDGKYDKDGKRVAPLRVALPFQTVETVNESAQERQQNLFAYAAQQNEWRNRLIWGGQEVRAAVAAAGTGWESGLDLH